jgi:hypothetical protein
LICLQNTMRWYQVILLAKTKIQANLKNGSLGRIRTYDQAINSRLLYH